MTLEAAMAVPFFLCAVTALLYLFVFTAQNGQAYRRLMEKAEMLAVTAGQITEDDPYIRLYDYETAELPFVSLFPVRHPVMRKVEIRGWTGYTGKLLQETDRRSWSIRHQEAKSIIKAEIVPI